MAGCFCAAPRTRSQRASLSASEKRAIHVPASPPRLTVRAVTDLRFLERPADRSLIDFVTTETSAAAIAIVVRVLQPAVPTHKRFIAAMNQMTTQAPTFSPRRFFALFGGVRMLHACDYFNPRTSHAHFPFRVTLYCSNRMLLINALKDETQADAVAKTTLRTSTQRRICVRSNCWRHVHVRI